MLSNYGNTYIYGPLANDVSFSNNSIVHDKRLSDCFKTNGVGEKKIIHAYGNESSFI